MAAEDGVRVRRYRRYVVVVAVVLGVAVGIGVGSIAALTRTWTAILLLAPFVALHLLTRARRAPTTPSPPGWIWLGVALVVAPMTYLVVPAEAAPIGLGLAVATWFGLIVISGVLEVVLDPDGHLAGG